MPALPEYRTRVLLESEGVPLVRGVFIQPGEDLPDDIPPLPLYLKAQIPGATSRKSSGLVVKVESETSLRNELKRLLSSGPWGQVHGVLAAEGKHLSGEYYAGCMLDFGSEDRLPGGVLLFSPQGGSGVESRSGSLVRIPFSLIQPPDAADIGKKLPKLNGAVNGEALAEFLTGMIAAFIRYRLTVLEINPVGVLENGDPVVIDCRAEFEGSAVSKKDRDLFTMPDTGSSRSLTRLEEVVERINQADPAGTGFFRQNREEPSEGSLRVATNLCGGGGKMLWEMTTGSRSDIFTMNESDTSGGLSAFKSYRILRVILAQKDCQVLLLTGSGMAFQNQHHIAAAVWKALKESPAPLPCLLRFGGTDEDAARDLFSKVKDSLSVPVKTYPPEIFPNAMVDDIREIAGSGDNSAGKTPDPPSGEPAIVVEKPPGRIHFFPDRWTSPDIPPSVEACPTGFLQWKDGSLTTDPDARCIGCLMCETAAEIQGNGEIYIHLELPEEVD